MSPAKEALLRIVSTFFPLGAFSLSEDQSVLLIGVQSDFDHADAEIAEASTCGFFVRIPGEKSAQLDSGIKRLPFGQIEDDDNRVSLSRWDDSLQQIVEIAFVHLVVAQMTLP